MVSQPTEAFAGSNVIHLDPGGSVPLVWGPLSVRSWIPAIASTVSPFV